MTFDSRIHFHGTFRSYQQKVLDRASEYLKDRHCHIVAAPGSGKTVLGLELICRLKAPCLILSPETTIRQQWGERFAELFMPEGAKLSDYFSFRLSEPKTFTCVTYQALYAAMNHLPSEEDSGDFDLMETLKKAGIRTICLDEAHHLRNDWQKALEQFLKAFRDTASIIALTATPPYDASPEEWQRYLDTCGEIDDEIFVPELVAQKTLCPHQDFIVFSYPAKKEQEELLNYQQKSIKTLTEIKESGILEPLSSRMDALADPADESIFVHADEMSKVLQLFNFFGVSYGENIRTALYACRNVPPARMDDVESALTFLISDDSPADETEKDTLLAILKKNGVLEKKKVTLRMNRTIKKHLLSSKGKMESIERICASESAALKDRLRMVILTDYIKKESLSPSYPDISISVGGIFRALYRKHLDAPLGAVSGSLIVLPLSLEQRVRELCDRIHCSIEVQPLGGTDYGEYTFSGSSKNQVQVVTELLGEGRIRILIGTRSLLGEGWDSPCVNSLILASTVGSFVLSNQMRGRAIRIDPKDPDKVSNIWHLVTVEPGLLPSEEPAWMRKEEDHTDELLPSDDFRTLSRRFDCFVGPDYENGVIRSGIQRIHIIRPPYTKSGFEKINKEMLERAADRDATRKAWENCANPDARLYREVAVPPHRVKPFRITGYVEELVLIIFSALLVPDISRLIENRMLREYSLIRLILDFVLLTCSIYGIYFAARRLSFALSGARTSRKCAEALLLALQDRGLVSKSCILKTRRYYDQYGILLETYYCIDCADRREQDLFCTALQELLSPVVNPRYLMLGIGFRHPAYFRSLACPEILGKNREDAEALALRLTHVLGRTEAVYVRNQKGRNDILNTRKYSFVSVHDRITHSLDWFGKI